MSSFVVYFLLFLHPLSFIILFIPPSRVYFFFAVLIYVLMLTTVHFFQAAKYWEMAAQLGDVRAMYQVGAMHIRGFLRNSDMNYGVELMKRSAEGGFCDAQFYLGIRALHELDYTLAEAYLKRTLHKEENRREMLRWLTIEGVPDEVRTMVNKLLYFQ